MRKNHNDINTHTHTCNSPGLGALTTKTILPQQSCLWRSRRRVTYACASAVKMLSMFESISAFAIYETRKTMRAQFAFRESVMRCEWRIHSNVLPAKYVKRANRMTTTTTPPTPPPPPHRRRTDLLSYIFRTNARAPTADICVVENDFNKSSRCCRRVLLARWFRRLWSRL